MFYWLYPTTSKPLRQKRCLALLNDFIEISVIILSIDSYCKYYLFIFNSFSDKMIFNIYVFNFIIKNSMLICEQDKKHVFNNLKHVQLIFLIC